MSRQTRVVNILWRPIDEWRTVAAEPATIEGLIRGYAAPLAAIPAVCQFVGFRLAGIPTGFFGTGGYSVARSLANGFVAWALGLVGVFVAAVVIERLAPTFQSRGGTAQALKLVVYSTTPVWIAGVFYLIPALSVLNVLAGFYAIGLFYLGLPIVMATPPDKVIPYMIASVLVVIVVWVVLAFLAGAIARLGVYSTL